MYLTAPSLAIMSGIRHGFFTRGGGGSDGIYRGLNCGFGSADDAATVRRLIEGVMFVTPSVTR